MGAKPRIRKRTQRPGAGRRRTGGESFFEPDPKRRRRRGGGRDETIESDESDGEVAANAGGGEEEEEEEREENADEARKRVAEEVIQRLRNSARVREEEEGEDGEGDEDRSGDDERIAEILQKKHLEESGRRRILLAARVMAPEADDKFQVLVKHRQSVTTLALTSDDERGFSASKDGSIVQWDVETGKSEKFIWPSEDVLISHHASAPRKAGAKRSKHVLALAVSSDGRYLACGGMDRDVHLWDVRTREHIQAFRGHKGAVSALAFGPGSSQLFSGSFDRTIMLWNAEDRTYMDSLFGHQNEILAIDCLRKERLLSVGRDRTMRLWKVPEESQLVFRAPAASLECCCITKDGEFISGSDDGSVEIWSIMRKKPVHIVKNAHPLVPFDEHPHETDNGKIPTENGDCKAAKASLAQSWVSSVAVCKNSDLAASGAANGTVRLWAIENDFRGIRPLFNYSVDGFVNSLFFAKSGRFILAGVGQEPRLGRWGRVSTAQNGVMLHKIKLID